MAVDGGLKGTQVLVNFIKTYVNQSFPTSDLLAYCGMETTAGYWIDNSRLGELAGLLTDSTVTPFATAGTAVAGVVLS